MLRWRSTLSKSLEEYLARPLDWDESPEASYFTMHKPTWECYGALLLWAAYEEHRELSCPSELVEAWEKDNALQACCGRYESESRYSQLFGVWAWFPDGFEFVFEATLVGGGTPMHMGSSARLGLQLAELNSRTWNADGSTIRQWAKEGAERGAPLEVSARFAFAALFTTLAEKSVAARLPMLIDW